jgi:hypothetical protein
MNQTGAGVNASVPLIRAPRSLIETNTNMAPIMNTCWAWLRLSRSPRVEIVFDAFHSARNAFDGNGSPLPSRNSSPAMQPTRAEARRAAARKARRRHSWNFRRPASGAVEV